MTDSTMESEETIRERSERYRCPSFTVEKYWVLVFYVTNTPVFGRRVYKEREIITTGAAISKIKEYERAKNTRLRTAENVLRGESTSMSYETAMDVVQQEYSRSYTREDLSRYINFTALVPLVDSVDVAYDERVTRADVVRRIFPTDGDREVDARCVNLGEVGDKEFFFVPIAIHKDCHNGLNRIAVVRDETA